MKRGVLFAVLAIGVSACGNLPRPFEHDPLAPTSPLTRLATANRVEIEPPTGVPPAQGRALAEALAADLQKRSVPARVINALEEAGQKPAEKTARDETGQAVAGLRTTTGYVIRGSVDTPGGDGPVPKDAPEEASPRPASVPMVRWSLFSPEHHLLKDQVVPLHRHAQTESAEWASASFVLARIIEQDMDRPLVDRMTVASSPSGSDSVAPESAPGLSKAPQAPDVPESKAPMASTVSAAESVKRSSGTPSDEPTSSAPKVPTVRAKPAVRPAPALQPTEQAGLPAIDTLPAVAVAEVSGFGDRRDVLMTGAIKVQFARIGLRLDDKSPWTVRTEIGQEVVGPAVRLRVIWRLVDDQGQEVGTVRQENPVPRDILDHQFSALAVAIAQGGADGVVALLAGVSPH